MTLSESDTFMLSSGETTLSDMQDNIAFIEAKADYFKAVRELQGITRTDLDLIYNFEDIIVNGDSASVQVSELASFYYTGETQQTFIEKIYNIDLINVSGKWLIADATDNEWFDLTYKDDSNFNVQAELSKIEEAMISESSESNVVEHLGDDSLSTTSTGRYQIPYNGENAAAYAFTYTRQKAEGSWRTYYNPNFAEWKSSDGADCMNFASQCMYAGFSGDGAENALDNHEQPMDWEEGATYQWFSCSSRTQAEGDKNSNSHPSWRSCKNFRLYLTGKLDGSGTSGSNNSTDVGMKALRLDIAEGAAISGTTASNLVGAIGHVLSGTGDPYGHAIIITNATGLTRDKIYFCAHTTDVKNVKLGDEFPGVMQIFIPQYFRTDKPSADYLKVNMLRPVSVNTTSTLKCYTTAAQYKFTIAVTAPDGTQTSTSASNTNSCSYKYKFTQTGLYTITCYSKSTSSAVAESVTFRVLAFTL